MKVRNAVLILSLASALASCHAPNAPQPLSPTLTLLFPDSTHVFDTVLFRGHYSDPIRSSWRFQWLFGDSTSTVSADSTITHVYDSAGTYNVQVTLVDSTGKTIAKQSGKISVLPLNGPTLTLSVPDTVYWGDSCVMRVSSSPFKSSWKYYWSFGDTTTFSSTQDSAVHWYLNPGTYTVLVDLVDTVNHIPLGSRTATVFVVARHFDLALLESMSHLDISWHAFVTSDTVTDGFGYLECEPYVYPTTFGPLTWTGMGFAMDDSFSSGSTEGPIYDTSAGKTTMSGYVDPGFTQIIGFSQEISNFASGGSVNPGNSFCTTTYQSSLSFSSIPFVSESDTEMIFEAIGDISHGNFNSNYLDRQIGLQVTVQSQVSWSEQPFLMFTPYVRFRFHK